MIDYAHPTMMAEKALKDLHSAMLDRRYEEAIDKAFAHAERTIEREIKGLERAEIEAEYAKVMSGQ